MSPGEERRRLELLRELVRALKENNKQLEQQNYILKQLISKGEENDNSTE